MTASAGSPWGPAQVRPRLHAAAPHEAGDPAALTQPLLLATSALAPGAAWRDESGRRGDRAADAGAIPRHDGSANDEFQRALRREQRRAQRSHSPLSLLVLASRADDGLSQDGAQGLLAAVLGAARETDTVGRLPDGRIAVLCPDTGAAGALQLTRRIERGCAPAPLAATQAAYPDRLFDTLAAARTAGYGDDTAAGAAARHGYPLKRALDVAGALFALVALAPLMALVALAIALTSPGPVIFRQKRLGKGGVPFVFYKFRSMEPHADDRIHREYVTGLINGRPVGPSDGAVFKMKSDPRITPFGRFIRRTSIDEIPQFFNVLKGDMSLVGPRPPVPYEVEKYEAWHLRRVLEMKPGITGIWQVEGRSRVSFDDMVRMDLRYLQSCSLGFDLRLLLRTVKAVLSCDGAE